MLVAFHPLGRPSCAAKRIFENCNEKKSRAGTGVPGEDAAVHWLILVLISAATLILLYGLFRWASADARIDAESSEEQFRAKQDWSGLHRSAIDAPDRQR